MTDNTSGKRGITAPGAIGVSFLVLVNGVTNGDFSRADSTKMYEAAAAVLGLGCLLYLYEDFGASSEETNDTLFHTNDGAEIWGGRLFKLVLRLIVQMSVVFMGWRICERFNWRVMRALIGGPFLGLFTLAVIITLLRGIALGLIALRGRMDKFGRNAPIWMSTVIDALLKKYLDGAKPSSKEIGDVTRK